MMKRFISLLMAVVMIFSITTVGAAASVTDVAISGGSVSADLTVGSTVSIPVSITENPGLAYAQVKASWDSSALKLTGVDYGTMPNYNSAAIEDGMNSYSVCLGDMLATENNNETGVLFTLNFEILSGAAAGNYTVALSADADAFLDKDAESHDAAFTDGTVTLNAVAVEESVAKIGDEKFDSLAAAVAAASENDTVVVTKEIALTESIEISGKKVTVDLNEQTVTATSAVFNLKNGAELNLSNGTVNATGDNSIVVWSEGNGSVANKINLSKVSLSADDFVVYHNGNYYGSEVTIANSELTSKVTAVYLSGLSTVGKWPEGKSNTLVIDNSKITGSSAVEVKRGNVTVNAGSQLVATATSASMIPNNSGTVATGYALALTSNAGKTVATATVNGGTFTGKIGIEKTEGVTNEAIIAVSGGTFSEAVAEEYCADGFEPKDNGDGTFGVKVEEVDNSVAKIGDEKFDSLADAVAAAGENDTVVVTKEITLTESIEISGKKVTVDLNEQTVTATSAVFTLKKGAELNLSNGTVNATGDNSIVVWSEGDGSVANKINLDGVTLTADTFVIYHNGLKYGADVTVADSTVTSAETVAIYLAGRATVDSSWPEGKNNTLVIENSKITGTTAVETKRGTVTVKDGSVLTATAATATMTPNKNGPASSGYALALTGNAGIAAGSATVTGGTFAGKIGIEVTEGVTNTATFAVSGGTFSEAIADEYCADGFEPKDNGDGTFGVKAEEVDNSVAKIGEEKFDDLAAAVAAAENGDTIAVLKDIELSAGINIDGKEITIDLGGKTVTAAEDAFTVKNGAGLTLVNGAVEAGGIAVWSVGAGNAVNTIKLDNVTATAESFAVYHNGSKYGAAVTITDSTVTSETVAVYLAGRATVDSSWPEGKNNTLVIENSKITGTTAVETKRGAVTVKDGSILTATAAAATMTPNKNGPASSGYALALTGNAGIAAGSATVTGGTFAGKIGIEVTEGVTNTATFAVSGGTFSEAIADEYCADGFEPKDNGDGTFGVKVEETTEEIDVKYNLTLESYMDFSFFVKQEDLEQDGMTVTIQQAGKEAITVTNWETKSGYWRFRYADVAPAEYEQELTIVIKNAAGEIVVEDVTTIKSYIELRISRNEDDAPMMQALLGYCAAAKTYFNK